MLENHQTISGSEAGTAGGPKDGSNLSCGIFLHHPQYHHKGNLDIFIFGYLGIWIFLYHPQYHHKGNFYILIFRYSGNWIFRFHPQYHHFPNFMSFIARNTVTSFFSPHIMSWKCHMRYLGFFSSPSIPSS